MIPTRTRRSSREPRRLKNVPGLNFPEIRHSNPRVTPLLERNRRFYDTIKRSGLDHLAKGIILSTWGVKRSGEFHVVRRYGRNFYYRRVDSNHEDGFSAEFECVAQYLQEE
jgi:hypothetical protein